MIPKRTLALPLKYDFLKNYFFKIIEVMKSNFKKLSRNICGEIRLFLLISKSRYISKQVSYIYRKYIFDIFEIFEIYISRIYTESQIKKEK